MNNLNQRIATAVRHFWTTRGSQARKQGSKTGERDQGARTAVTGGAQLDGFVSLIRELLIENDVPNVAGEKGTFYFFSP